MAGAWIPAWHRGAEWPSSPHTASAAFHERETNSHLFKAIVIWTCFLHSSQIYFLTIQFSGHLTLEGLKLLVPWSCLTFSSFMDFSRQEYWIGWPFSAPREVPDPGIEPQSPALQADSLPSEPPGKPTKVEKFLNNHNVYQDERNSMREFNKCSESLEEGGFTPPIRRAN